MFCQAQLVKLSKQAERFAARDARLVGISSDTAGQAAALHHKLKLAFPLLSDAKMAAIKAYGVREKDADRALPAIFIVDKQRTIRRKYVGQRVDDRPDYSEVLSWLEAVRKADGK